MEGICRLRLLGPVQVERDGEPVHGFRSRKALALLGYLAVQDHPLPRERLVDLLWEDQPEAQGRANLSWVLHRISTLLPGCLAADRHTVQFQRAAPSTSSPRLRSGQAGQAPSTSSPRLRSGQAGQAPSTSSPRLRSGQAGQAPYWLDIVAFQELEAQGDAVSLAAALELYRGEFLEGLYLHGCAEFEIWLVAERERWRQRVARVLAELVTHHTRRGEYQQSLRFAQRLLALEPWREETHRQVMRLLTYSGQRGAALAQYETCRRVLAEELGVEPAAETTKLYEQIRHGELEIPLAPPGRPLDLPVHPPSFLDKEEPVASPVFVARERELAQLDGFLEKALAGQGWVVFVTGDAGQGKTALVREFARRAQAAHPDLIVANGHGNVYTGLGDPYLPFREVLGLLTGDVEARWAAGAMTRDQALRLWHLLPLTVQALVEAGPDLIDLFVPGAALVKRAAAFAPGGADWLPQLEELVKRKALRQAQDTAAIPGDPNLQQSALFEQYTRVLQALARQRPLLLVLDDLQWVDSGSASLLFHLGRHIEDSRILIVGAYRPEEVTLGRPASPLLAGELALSLSKGIEGGRLRHPLEPIVNEFKRHFGDIGVDLGQAEDRQFVDALLDTEPNRLGDAFRKTLYRQTGGHPLFTVELLRGMEERGDLAQDPEGRWVEGPALDWETLPARVEAVIAERIGQLPERLRDTLMVASVEGETFTAEVVARVGAANEREMVGRLSGELDRRYRLVNARGILRTDPALSGAKGGQRPWLEPGRRLSQYRFRHILFQKYLHNSLDPVERAHLHEAVGTALEGLYGEGVEEIAVQLARHFQEAGIAEKAVDYLCQAGERAARMSAHAEAIAHFTQGLELLETLPDGPERARQELALQLALSVSLQVTRGYGDPQVGRAYARARELCQQASSRGFDPRGSARGKGETPQLFPVLGLLLTFYGARGEHQTACEIGEQLLNLAEQAGDPLLVALAHWQLGVEQLFLGELTQAQAHLERMIAFYDPQQHHTLAFRYGLDPGIMSLSATSWALWALGYPEQALRRSQKATALAQELPYLPTLIMTQTYAVVLHIFYQDWQRVQELAEASIQLSTEHGLVYWLSAALACRGLALAEQGRAEEGIAQLRQSIAACQATGAELLLVFHFALLAEAYKKAGQAEEGLAAVAEALAAVSRTGERLYETEVHRLKGELLRMQGVDPAEVEACFHQAIEVARRQQARSWELRAVMSLCRLWQEQGKGEEARKLLAEIYGWFTEGFDTPDLTEARALLEELP